MDTLFQALHFDQNGLIPVVVQDWKDGQILMMAWMNREALEKTLKGPHVTYWSRSRKKIWVKGEESGHTQGLKELRVDCDGDTLLIKVDQKKAACHEGFRSCFFRRSDGSSLTVTEKKMFDPQKTYPRGGKI